MSRDLITSLTRGAEAGEEMFAPRADVVTSQTRARVRRTRTLRGVALGATATVAVIAGVVGVLAIGSPGIDMAPATIASSPHADGAPSSDPITTEDLLVGWESREREDANTAPRDAQAALVCSVPAGGISANASAACPAAWVWSAPLLEPDPGHATARLAAAGDTATLTIDWALSYRGSRPLAAGGASAIAAIETDPGAVADGATIASDSGGSAITATSLWQSDSERLAVLSPGPVVMNPVAPHTVITGSTEMTAFAPRPDAPVDPLWDLITNRPGTSVTLTLLIPVQGAGDAGSIVFLEASTQVQVPALSIQAEDLADLTSPRDTTQSRADAQAAVTCGGADPASCARVWIEASPLLEVTFWEVTPTATWAPT